MGHISNCLSHVFLLTTFTDFLNRFVTIARAAKTGAVPQPCFLALHCDVFAKVVPAAQLFTGVPTAYTYIGFGYPSSQTELEQRGGGRGEGASQLAGLREMFT